MAKTGDVATGAAEAVALAEELLTMWRGDPWHGPALAKQLEQISPDLAAAHPIPAGHSILELVLHLSAWTDVVRRRLDGDPIGDPEIGDFPQVEAPVAKAWADARSAVAEAHLRLADRVARMTADELEAEVPGRGYSGRFLVRGGIAHTVYHTAQIGLLRKSA
jgi:uncharacterized damage-inducible protein DinB